jgi:L-lactate dehydrogenase complex protein LldF
VLIHLRSKVVERDQETLTGKLDPWNLGMKAAAFAFESGDRLELGQKLGRLGQLPFVAKSGFIEHLPLMLAGWTQSRDLAPIPKQSFRQWWAERKQSNEEAQA